jgi:hypothetical protein
MEETQKKKSILDNLVGLAAIIASVAIPLAQLGVGYYQNRTTQQQNRIADEEKRRFEITKLFMDNYAGKNAETQIATIQIMKGLDPAFFITIESGLKEATKSDSVKASIRRATVEAATELGNDPTVRTKNRKVQKVLSAKEFESQGLQWVSKGDFDKAQESFQKSNQEYKTYESMDEFMKKHDNEWTSDLSREQRKKLKEFYKKNSSSKIDGFPPPGFTEIK